MRDLTAPFWIKAKGLLFLLLGLAAAALLLLEQPRWRVAMLLALAIWAFCRAYYCAFYVIEHYVDPSYRFSGLLDFVRYWVGIPRNRQAEGDEHTTPAIMPTRLSSSGGSAVGRRSPLLWLRLFLAFCGVTWGAAVAAVFLNWPAAAQAMEGFGAQPLAFDPMLDYWLRMVGGAFALMGGLFLVLAVAPQRHLAIIPWFGVLMLLEGVVLLVHGVRLALPPFPFYADTSACFVGGIGILIAWRSARHGLAKSP